MSEGDFSKDSPWFKIWQNKSIPLDRVFDEGGKQNLVTADGRREGTITLVDRLGNSGELVGFKVQVNNGQLKPAWDGITLAPMGFRELFVVGQRLPPWDPNLPADRLEDLNKRYERALSKVVDLLTQDKTNLLRLEGYLPLRDQNTGGFNIDLVRIVRIPELVETAPEVFADLALVVLKLFEPHGQAPRQDGGGSGPPR